jgi:hypothetical protein
MRFRPLNHLRGAGLLGHVLIKKETRAMMSSGKWWCSVLVAAVCMAPWAMGETEKVELRQKEIGPADPLLPHIEVVVADKAPVIDGKLDDACWKKAKESAPMTDEYGFPLKLKTTFKICQKDEVLYLAFHCANEPGKSKQSGGGSDGKDAHDRINLWYGENIEVFLDPDNGDTPAYYQLVVTPFDQTGDLFNTRPQDPERQWEPEYQVKSTWSDDAWTVEYAIPFKVFSRTDTIYENIGMNVHRVDGTYWGIGAWSAGRTEGFHFPHRFGEIRGLKGADVKPNTPGLFRQPFMGVSDEVIHAKGKPSLVPAETPKIVDGPNVKVSGKGVAIDFEVNTLTDVAVWIEDEKGETVCHLAAGMLGPNAPAPLQKDALKQKLVWDRKDDWGKPVPEGKFQVKLGLRSQATLSKVIGLDTTPKQINAIAIDDKGRLITLGGERDSWMEIQRFDHSGKFENMLFPAPGNLPPEKLAGYNIIDLGPDGQIRWGSHRLAAMMPHLDQPMPHNILVNSQGQLIFLGCEYQGGPGHLYKINADGSLPPDFIGPYLKDLTWQQYYDFCAKRFHFALDPDDEKIVYVSGVKELHRLETAPEHGKTEFLPAGKYRETIYNVVMRMHWDKARMPEAFVGKRNLTGNQGSDKPGEFSDPQGICFDKDKNLWVCDRANNRIQIFNRDGKFLRQFAHPRPYLVAISKKTGCAYVMGTDEDDQVYVTKYSDGKSPKVLAKSVALGPETYWRTMALDETGSKPELRIVSGDTYRCIPQADVGKNDDSHSTYIVDRMVDQGKAFSEPEIIIGKHPPRSYGRIAVGWENDIIAAGNRYWYDGISGKFLGMIGKPGSEVAAFRDGTWAVREGFVDEGIRIMPADWPSNPEANALDTWKITPMSLNRAGQRGFSVAPNGDIYVARYYQWIYQMSLRGGQEGSDHHMAVDRYTKDGKLVGQRVISELSTGAQSPLADIHGNIYVIDNHGRKLGQLYEDDVADNLPTWIRDLHKTWKIDWDKIRKGESVEAGYNKFVYDPLVKSIGTLYKFGPEGGGLIWRAAQGPYVQHMPATNAQGKAVYSDWGFPSTPMPDRPATHWSASVINGNNHEGVFPQWQEGVKWELHGVGSAWGRYNKGHSSCCCQTIRNSVDDFGRTYTPAVHRSTVRMVDTAGNEILRIGSYGNLASYGPGSPVPDVKIPLMHPSTAVLSKKYLYVSEERYARILRIELGYEQEKSADAVVR